MKSVSGLLLNSSFFSIGLLIIFRLFLLFDCNIRASLG
ncbi:unnamed protein product [Brassica oleracea]